MVMKKKENNNNVKQDRKEWSREWGLEKQTEGLDKKAVAEQTKIGKSLTHEHDKHKNGCGCK